jgi:hypothetical protein
MGRSLRSVALLAVAVGLTAPAVAQAATPASGTVSAGHAARWQFAPVGGPSGATDTYKLNVQLPASAARLYAANLETGTDYAVVLTIKLTWQGTSPDDTLGLSAADPSGASVGNDTLATTNEGGDVNTFVLQDPLAEAYTITASNQLGNSTSAVPSSAVATLKVVNLASEKPPAEVTGAQGFTDYHIPLNLMPETLEEQQVLGGRSFGEPSIGVDPRNDDVMYQAGLFTLRGVFDTSTTPATASWTNVSTPETNTFSEDAILDVDRNTGRTLVAQLDLACSLSAVSDDDGNSWTPAPKSCQTPPGPDHPTIGNGPFAPPLTGTAYPDAVYYCSQSIAYASCALSLDGGLTYTDGLPMYTSAQCFGLHGHIKVGPDGAVYVPNKACGSPECIIVSTTAGGDCHQGFAVSTDDAQTWTVQTIPDSHTRLFDQGDPALDVGPKGTLYFGYADRTGYPMIAVCHADGTVCSKPTNVGAGFHIQNTEMPTVVVGDDNRAAFGFLGSTTPGDDQQSNVEVTDANGNTVNKVFPWHDFMGTWRLYIAYTYDGGRHWTTVDATPDAPIERGCIEFNASCPSTRGSDDQRNLLDFNDITIDGQGRVLAAYTDGCQPDLGPPKNHGTCLTDATRLSGLAPEIQGPAVARQDCGLGLYAKYDGIMPACPPEHAFTVAAPR